MSSTATATDATVEYFGRYIHSIRFRTQEDIERHLPAVMELLGEGVEDLPVAHDGELGCYIVDLVTNEPLGEAQIAAIQQTEGVLSCSCNEDMQKNGVGT